MLVMVLSLVGCASAPAPKAATPERRSISAVTQDLHTRLAKDARLQGSTIDFDYDGNTVILHGQVKDKDQFGWAATIAAGTPGVKSVINRLQIATQAPAIPAPQS